MGPILAVQDSALGVWMRESDWALFAALIIHTLAMGFVVGTAGLIAARVLGLAADAPFERVAKLFSAIKVALGFVVFSGLGLMIAYPAKALTNPWFYVKLCLVAGALTLTWQLVSRLRAAPDFRRGPAWARSAAIASLVLWPAALTTGKYLAYTAHVITIYL